MRVAVQKISGDTGVSIVEPHAESVLDMADQACALLNGRMAYSGPAQVVADDQDLQQRLLGVAQTAELAQEPRTGNRLMTGSM